MTLSALHKTPAEVKKKTKIIVWGVGGLEKGGGGGMGRVMELLISASVHFIGSLKAVL